MNIFSEFVFHHQDGGVVGTKAESCDTCPACAAKRIHKPEEWDRYHPQAGTGFKKGDGRE
jgi:hypothetical protein